MDKQDNNEYEIIDDKGGKLAKIGKDTKLFLNTIVDKIGDLPNFAKELLKSSDKTEENYNDFVKQDKDIIETIIKKKLENGNYTTEELEKLLDRSEKITEKQETILDKLTKHKRDILLIVSGCMIVALKAILDERNKA